MVGRRLCLACAAALLGCGGSVPGDEAPPLLTLVQVQRIGSVDGPDALSRVVGLALDGSQVFVLEALPPRILRFGLRGEYLGELGGPGAGPGEFTGPSGMGIADSLIWVADTQGHEMELFGRDGRFRRSMRIEVEPEEGGSVGVPRAWLATGRIIAGPAGLSIGPILSGRLTHVTFHLVDPDGRVVARLGDARIPPSDYFQATLSDGRVALGGHPIQEAPLEAFFPDGSGMLLVERWVAEDPDSAAYRLRVWNADGDLETDRAIAYVPRSGEGSIARVIEARRGEDWGTDKASQNRMLDVYAEAWSERAYLPPVTAVVAGADGTMLLRREETGEPTVECELRDRQGGLLGRLSIPRDVRVLAVTRDEVWLLETDALDVPYVVRNRMEG
jgi:hypothetical protein